MRTRSFPGFDDDFSDIMASDATAAAAAAASASTPATSSAQASVGWFQDDDVERIYVCLQTSLSHHTVPPSVDASSVANALASAMRFASQFNITLPATPSVNMAFFISSQLSHSSLTTAPLLTDVPSNINIFKETAVAEVQPPNLSLASHPITPHAGHSLRDAPALAGKPFAAASHRVSRTAYSRAATQARPAMLVSSSTIAPRTLSCRGRAPLG
jgi:hypothetical protein